MVAIEYSNKYIKTYTHILIAIFILILSSGFACAAEANYNFVVKENGETTSAIILKNPGNINIPLPLDASPSVKGALYVQASNGIDVQVGTVEGLIVYKSQYHTAKSANWIFEAQISNYTKSVILELPSNIEILTTSENAIISSGDKIRITWEEPDQMIRVTYRFLDINENKNLAYVYILVVLLIVILGFFGIKRLREKLPEKEVKEDQTEKPKIVEHTVESPETTKIVSDSQLNIMKTLSSNEEKVMRILMQEKNLKRNILEKKTQLAKSSLAGALNNLEKKNIVRIDRSHTVHFISLTEWFKDLA